MNDSGNDNDGHVRQSEWQRLLEEYKPVAWIVIGGVLVFFLVLGLIPHVLACIGLVDEAGTFGDSFGFVNSFFSGFAVAGLLVTIWVQIREFKLAQVERMDALRMQSENIRIQERISQQQERSSLIQAISTWSDLHPHRAICKETWTLFDIEYLHARYINVTVLAATRDDMLRTPSQETVDERLEFGRFVFNFSEAVIEATETYYKRVGVNGEFAWDAALELRSWLDQKLRDLTKEKLALVGKQHTFIMMVDRCLNALSSDLRLAEKVKERNPDGFSKLIESAILALKGNYADLIGDCLDYDSWSTEPRKSDYFS